MAQVKKEIETVCLLSVLTGWFADIILLSWGPILVDVHIRDGAE